MEGSTPKGITKVIHADTEIAYALYRTQLFNPERCGAQIQEGYKVQTLSKFSGTPAPKAAPAIEWPKPQPDMLESPALFRYLNFLLTLCPPRPARRRSCSASPRSALAVVCPSTRTN